MLFRSSGNDNSPEDADAQVESWDADDPRWRDGAPWLVPLLAVPAEASWPRFMSAPHPRAVGTLGAEFVAAAEARTGGVLRWWQRLVAYRLLEVDAAGVLVWASLVLTMARQLGKSWLIRELCLWRLRAAALFGEPQLILHTGKDLNICREVQRPARRWARERGDVFKVREVNGQEEILFVPDDSRWMIRARDAVYGYGATMPVVDEAWKVAAKAVDDGIEPTTAEREQAQLLLVSTAHRAATTLMLGRRAAALSSLSAPDDCLLVEWSAPRTVDLGDVSGWRAASPHWTPKRERLIRAALTRALAGNGDDPDEPDPIESFRAQWLNQWPARSAPPVAVRDEALLADGVWEACGGDGDAAGNLVLAVEDWFGHGAAAAAVGELADGRLVVGGWEFDRWADAFAWVGAWCDMRPGSRLVVGASMAGDRSVREVAATVVPMGRQNTAHGLSLLRDLVAAGQVVHDGSPDLARQVARARVTSGPGGLRLGEARSDLLRCVVWALTVADRARGAPPVAIW